MYRRAFTRFVLLATLALPLAACGGDSATGPRGGSAAGTWNLQTVNGRPLPYVLLQQGADRFELIGDSFTLSSSTFTQTTSFRTVVNGQSSTESEGDAGSYTLNGNALRLTFDSDGSSSTASVSGNTITISEDGLVGVYQRQ